MINPGTNQLFKELNQIANTSNDEFLTLPPEAYYSQDLFDVGKEVIFRQGWVLIGRKDQVANPGDYMALRLCDENIVMTRDGNLIRKGPPNKSRPGSSVGRISQTQVSGADKLTRDLEALFEGLRRLGLSGKQAKKITGSVSKQVSATAK
tara:strand:- start:123 stop:572 length:450 start_codon:yes stop_codon:yes gene_type:complete